MNRKEQKRPMVRLSDLFRMLVLILAATALAVCGSAQDSKAPETPPIELVRAAVANEVAAANNTTIKFKFLSRKQTPKGTQNKIYVEANEALATMVISENDQPLTPEKERAEIDHLGSLARNPRLLRRQEEQEKQQLEHTLRIVKALPDAFAYEYAGTQMGERGFGKAGDPLVKLNFSPNPSYEPPSRVEQVLVGMSGYVLIDTAARRLARIEGTLFKSVTFGWGIFGRLDKGGHFLIQQADAGDGNWAITEMSLNIKGKILLIKSLVVVSDEVFTDFQRLPDDVPFARAVELLQTEHAKLTQDGTASKAALAKKAPQ